MDLTPEQLQALYQQYLQGNYGGLGGYSPSYVSGADGTPSQFLGYDNQSNYYAPSGQDMGKITYGDPYELLKAAAFLGAFAVGGSALGAAAGGTGGMFGAGAGFAGDATAAGYDPLYGASTSTGGTGALGGGGLGAGYAGDATAAGYDPAFGAYSGAPDTSVMGGSSGGYGGSDIFGGNGMASGFTDTGTAGGAMDSYGGSGALTGAGGTAAPSSNWLSSMLGSGSSGSSLLGSGSSLLGPMSTILGGLAGSKGAQTSATTTKSMDPRLAGAVYGAGGVVPMSQALMGAQLPQALQAGQQMIGAGSSLLNQPIAGNGVGQVKLNAPTTATNPYLSGMADDMQRRTALLLGQNNNAIQGNFVGSGALGGSRQGVAQGIAAGQAADSLQGQLANLYGTQYNNDQNRAMQQYGLDQNFYGQQRGQDQAGATLGGALMSQGLNAGWQPIQNAANTYSNFTGFGTTSGQQQTGGGLTGALGGALGVAQIGKTAGWW